MASVLITVADLIFLAVAWEFLGKPRLGLNLWFRAFLTLLGVMWLDVLLFTTGAFFGTPKYLNIMMGTLSSRLIISGFACPVLYGYLRWQKNKQGLQFENRPVLAILKEVADIRIELNRAQQEIDRRKKAEIEKAVAFKKLEASLLRVQRLEGVLPICASCKKIRVEPSTADEAPHWVSLEAYLHEETPVRFSHGICPVCEESLYASQEEESVPSTSNDGAAKHD